MPALRISQARNSLDKSYQIDSDRRTNLGSWLEHNRIHIVNPVLQQTQENSQNVNNLEIPLHFLCYYEG